MDSEKELRQQPEALGYYNKVLGYLKPLIYVGVFFLAVVFAYHSNSFLKVNQAHAGNACVATTTSATVNWSSASSWTSCGSTYPGAAGSTTDTVTFGAAAGTTIINDDTSVTVASITFNANTAAKTLNINSGVTLTVNGAVTLSTPGTSGSNTLAVGTGTLIASSTSISGASSKVSTLSVSIGTLTVNGNMSFPGTTADEAFTTTGAATINLNADALGSGGTLTINSSTNFKFTGTSSVAAAYTLGQEEIVSGTTTFSANMTVRGLQVDSGATLAAGANLITNTGIGTGTSGFEINGTLSGSGGETLSGNGITIDGSGIVSNTGILTVSTTTIASTASTTIAGKLAIGNTVTVTNYGIISITNASGITGGNASSTLINAASTSNLIVAGPILATGILTATASGNTVNYAGAATAIKIVSYVNLTLSGSSTDTGAVTTVTGTLNVGGTNTWIQDAITSTVANVTLTGASNLTPGANMAISGSLTVGTGCTFTGKASDTVTVTGATSVTGTLTFPNSAALQTFTGGVTINSGGSMASAGNSTFSFGANGLTNNGSTITLGTGLATFTATGSGLAGTGNISFGGGVTIGSGQTITNANSGTVSIAGTVTLTGNWTQAVSSSLTLSGATPFIGAGTFNASTNTPNTVTYSGTSQTVLNITYTNLTFSGTASVTQTFTVDGTFSVSNEFTPSAGTVTMNNGSSISNSGTLTFNALTIPSSAVVTTSANFAFNNALTVSSSAVFTPSNGTITASSSSASISNSGTLTFNALTLGTSALITSSSSWAFNNVLTLNSGTRMVPTGGTITASSSSASLSNSGTLYFNNLTLAASANITTSSNFSFNNALTVASGTTLAPAGGTVTASSTGWTIINSGTLDFNALTVAATPSSQTSSSFSVSGGALTVNSGVTLEPSAGTITIAATSSISNLGTLKFYQLTINGTVTSATGFNIENALTVGSSGSFSASTGTTTMEGITSISNSGTLSFDNLAIGNAVAATTTSISAATATTTVSGNLIVGSTSLFNAGANPWALTATRTPFVVNSGGQFTASSSLFSFQATTGTTTIPSLTFYNLDFSPASGTPQYQTATGTLTVTNNFTTDGAGNELVNASASSTVISIGGSMAVNSGDSFQTNSNVTVSGGTVSGSGTITATGGTFEIDGTGNFGGSTAWTFNNLNIGDGAMASTTEAGSGNITVSGVLAIGSTSSLNAGSNTWLLSGSGRPLVNNGAFAAGTSTFDFTGTSATAIPVLNYYNLQSAPASGSPVYSFNAPTYYQRAITLNLAAYNPGAESSFTVLVCANGASPCNTSVPGLNQSGAGAHVQNSNGYDIIFSFTACTSPTLLNWEMENYVPSTGEMEAWVLITSLGTSNQTIYMCYGNAAISTFQGGAIGSAWNSNYQGVWHLPNGTSLTANDSTSNGNNGTLTNSPHAIAGQIDGGAEIYRGAGTDNYISVGSGSSLNITGKAITIQAWFKRNNTSFSGNNTIFQRGSGGVGGYALNVLGTQTTTSFDLVVYGIADQEGGAIANDTNWHHIVVVENSSNVTFYVDGVATAGTPTSNSIQTYSGTASIGPADEGSLNNDFDIDEVRINNTTLSANWITTEYNNQSSPSSFETFGSEQTVLSPGFTTGFIISNNLTVGDGTHSLTLVLPSASTTVSGTLTVSSGTLDLNSSSTPLTVTGTVTNSGTISASASQPLTLRGNFTNNGTFTHNNGSVVAAPLSLTAVIGGSSSTTFYNFTASTPGSTLEFGHGDQIGFVGVLSLQGADSNPINVKSDSSGNQWLLNLSGTVSITNIILTDSGCAATTLTIAANSRVTSGGNNGICWGLPSLGSGGGFVAGGGAMEADNSDGGGGSQQSGGGSSGGGGDSEGDGGGGGGGSQQSGGGSSGGGGGGASP